MKPRKTNQPQEFDAYRDSYSDDIERSLAFSGQSHDFFIKTKADHIVEILAQELQNNDDSPLKLLDVGCGHGLVHSYLLNQKKIQIDLTGIDVAASVIDIACQKNPVVKYDTYDGIKLPYKDNSFSCAYTICVMHHVSPEQWADFLHEMKRVVIPGGLVIVFEHNPLNPVTRRIVNNCPLDKHAILLKAGFLQKLFQKTSLTNLQKRFILFTPFSHALFRCFDNWLGWLPLGAQYYIFGRVS
jgi:ubiquinone/menaquinone biosynthesis C-methylase UbiE